MVLNKFSEYVYFTYQKMSLHTLLLLVFKIAESLQSQNSLKIQNKLKELETMY